MSTSAVTETTNAARSGATSAPPEGGMEPPPQTTPSGPLAKMIGDTIAKVFTGKSDPEGSINGQDRALINQYANLMAKVLSSSASSIPDIARLVGQGISFAPRQGGGQGGATPPEMPTGGGSGGQTSGATPYSAAPPPPQASSAPPPQASSAPPPQAASAPPPQAASAPPPQAASAPPPQAASAPPPQATTAPPPPPESGDMPSAGAQQAIQWVSDDGTVLLDPSLSGEALRFAAVHGMAERLIMQLTNQSAGGQFGQALIQALLTNAQGGAAENGEEGTGEAAENGDEGTGEAVEGDASSTEAAA